MVGMTNVTTAILSVPVRVPTDPPPEKRRGPSRPSLPDPKMTCVHLSRSERAALDDVVQRHGILSRAEAVRVGIRLAIAAVGAGGYLQRTPQCSGEHRSGEGITVPGDELAALAAAAAKSQITVSAAIRWGCLELIAGLAPEASNGSH